MHVLAIHVRVMCTILALQAVIIPALCFLKIMEKKATKIQV